MPRLYLLSFDESPEGMPVLTPSRGSHRCFSIYPCHPLRRDVSVKGKLKVTSTSSLTAAYVPLPPKERRAQKSLGIA
jgi:hypothetical protein